MRLGIIGALFCALSLGIAPAIELKEVWVDGRGNVVFQIKDQPEYQSYYWLPRQTTLARRLEVTNVFSGAITRYVTYRVQHNGEPALELFTHHPWTMRFHGIEMNPFDAVKGANRDYYQQRVNSGAIEFFENLKASICSELIAQIGERTWRDNEIRGYSRN